MKKPLLYLAVLLSVRAIAQPEFTKNDMYPTGFAYKNYFVHPDSIDIEISGVDSDWDFSKLNPINSEDIQTEALAKQGAYDYFPLTSFVIRGLNGADSLFRYFVTNDNSFGYYGYYQSPNDGFPPPPGGDSPFIYNPPVDYFRFPSTMGTTFTQSIRGYMNLFFDSLYRVGTQTVTFDGYGTLITPAGTFRNVLRFNTVKDYIDSTGLDGLSKTYHVQSWTWISAATRGVFLLHKEITTTTDVNAGNQPFSDTTAWYSDAGGVGFERIPERSFILYPNPMQEMFTLSGIAEAGSMTVDLFSVTGQLVQRLYSGNLNGQFYNLQLSLKNVAPGFYVVNLNNGTKSESYPVIVK